YFPHVSLTYGGFSPETVAVLQQQLAERHNLTMGKKFLVQGVELWRTEGEVKDWYKVSSFPFRH
ncbi:MAG: hypothetical protein WAP52_01830, partial [Candidatus Sungiibacteriota bacterium]